MHGADKLIFVALLFAAGCGPTVQVLRHGAAYAPRAERCAMRFDAELDPQTVSLRYELIGQIVVSGAEPGTPQVRELVRRAACRLGGKLVIPGAALGSAGANAEVYLVLGRPRSKAWTIGEALQADSAGVLAVAKGAREEQANAIAVFDVADRTGVLSAAQREQLSEYLASRLAQQPGYGVAPRGRVRAQLTAQRKASYRDCYDASCQIEIGRALAAQKSLSTQLLQIGTGCALAANLYDLRTETTEQAATVSCRCAAGPQLFGCVDLLVHKLVGH
jgi:hypothetical protein